MNTVNTIAAMWQDFEEKVVAKDAPQIQRKEMKLAFYAGALGTLSLLTEFGADNVSEDAGVMMLEGLHQELAAFQADVAAGKA